MIPTRYTSYKEAHLNRTHRSFIFPIKNLLNTDLWQLFIQDSNGENLNLTVSGCSCLYLFLRENTQTLMIMNTSLIDDKSLMQRVDETTINKWKHIDSIISILHSLS